MLINFKESMHQLCNESGWEHYDLSDLHLGIIFNMQSGRHKTLYVLDSGSHISFLTPSLTRFDSEENIPDNLSTALLERNADYKVGNWIIEKNNNEYIFSLNYNYYGNEINFKLFKNIIDMLVFECDEFDGIILDVLSSINENRIEIEAINRRDGHIGDFNKEVLKGAARKIGSIAVSTILGMFNIKTSV